jgi:hypothetical protein
MTHKYVKTLQKKKYYVLWTYIANFSSVIEVEAETSEAAVKIATYGFSDDFHKKARIYVWDTPPVLTMPRDPEAPRTMPFPH